MENRQSFFDFEHWICCQEKNMISNKPTLPQISAICAIALLAYTFNARSEDITDVAGRTYSNVELVHVEPDGLTLRHDAGFSKVYFWELPEAIQEKHGYKPENAEAFRKQQQLSQSEYEKRRQAVDKEGSEGPKEESTLEFPVRVHNIVPIEGRITRVRFDVQNNTTDDLIIRVHYKDLFIKGGETLTNQMISFSRSLDFMKVDAKGETKTYRVDWSQMGG